MQTHRKFKPIILASASEARRQLLKRAGVRFTVAPSHVPELRGHGRTLRQTVLANAARKAAAMARHHSDRWVLAADTMLEYRGRIYGKPSSQRAAIQFLSRLAGRTHRLATGVVLRRGEKIFPLYDVSRITLRPLTRAQIARILKGTNPTRFAGGYSMKVKDPLIARVEGSLSNIIGLPMEKVLPLLRRVKR